MTTTTARRKGTMPDTQAAGDGAAPTRQPLDCNEIQVLNDMGDRKSWGDGDHTLLLIRFAQTVTVHLAGGPPSECWPTLMGVVRRWLDSHAGTYREMASEEFGCTDGERDRYARLAAAAKRLDDRVRNEARL